MLDNFNQKLYKITGNEQVDRDLFTNSDNSILCNPFNNIVIPIIVRMPLNIVLYEPPANITPVNIQVHIMVHSKVYSVLYTLYIIPPMYS